MLEKTKKDHAESSTLAFKLTAFFFFSALKCSIYFSIQKFTLYEMHDVFLPKLCEIFLYLLCWKLLRADTWYRKSKLNDSSLEKLYGMITRDGQAVVREPQLYTCITLPIYLQYVTYILVPLLKIKKCVCSKVINIPSLFLLYTLAGLLEGAESEHSQTASCG